MIVNTKELMEREMTPEESAGWFKRKINSRYDEELLNADLENMYQAFYARMLQDLKREMTCNCLVNVDEVMPLPEPPKEGE